MITKIEGYLSHKMSRSSIELTTDSFLHDEESEMKQ